MHVYFCFAAWRSDGKTKGHRMRTSREVARSYSSKREFGGKLQSKLPGPFIHLFVLYSIINHNEKHLFVKQRYQANAHLSLNESSKPYVDHHDRQRRLRFRHKRRYFYFQNLKECLHPMSSHQHQSLPSPGTLPTKHPLHSPQISIRAMSSILHHSQRSASRRRPPKTHRARAIRAGDRTRAQLVCLEETRHGDAKGGHGRAV